MKQPVAYRGMSADDRPMGPAPLSPAILSGSLLFLSGQVAIDPATGLIVGDTVAEQTRQVIANMDNLLASAGMTLAKLCKVTIYLTDLAAFSEMNAVYSELIPSPFPARATVGVSLNDPRLLIEMEAIAAR
jgi:2-iminobutanoate/2-iminopropanoate deaminase